MQTEMKVSPVEDSVPKINNEFAVGDDLNFQKRWKRLERLIWSFLSFLLILTLAGVFGRGPLANASRTSPDGSMTIRYERVQRFSTPSVIVVNISPSSSERSDVKLWVGDTLVKPLGNQRVIPQPAKSELVDSGILYTFPVDKGPASIEFQTQPSALGLTRLTLHLLNQPPTTLSIFVMP